MSALFRAELIKLRTTRTFVALAGAAALVSPLMVALTAGFNHTIDPRVLFSMDLTSLFVLLLGVIGMAGEWRHRTITSAVSRF